MDMKIEGVLPPVTDVAAKQSYKEPGWREDADFVGGDDYRIVQLTPPGSGCFLTLVPDGERLTGAYALGPEAGECLQQATAAIRARTSLPVLHDVIQPFPTFSEGILQALRDLDPHVAAAPPVPAAAIAGSS